MYCCTYSRSGRPAATAPRDRLVVHVGEIHDVEDVVPARLEPAAQEVLEQERPEVSDVGVVVDGGAAGIERDPARLEGNERLDLAGERVVEAEAHPPAAPAAAWATGSLPAGPPSTARGPGAAGTESRASPVEPVLDGRRNSRATVHCEPGWVRIMRSDHHRAVAERLDAEDFDGAVELGAPGLVGGELRGLVPHHLERPVHVFGRRAHPRPPRRGTSHGSCC